MISLPDWLTGYDSENAERANEADTRLRQLNEDRAAQLGPEWKAQVDANYNTQVPFDTTSQRADIQDAFGEGLEDGRRNVTGFIGGAFNFVGKSLAAVLLGVPVWVWLLGGLAIWFYLGAPGARKLKGKFA